MPTPRILPHDYRGNTCPMCESTALESQPKWAEYDDAIVYWPMRCTTCRASWDEVFTLSHYDNLEEGHPQ